MNYFEYNTHLNKLIGYGPQLLFLIFFSLTIVFSLPSTANAQRKCGGEGQRPCKIWERIPSCNKGLRENFKLNKCVGQKTQIDAKTEKHILRDTRKMTELSLCNRSSAPVIYAALAEYMGDDDHSWVSRGWFRIPAGQCEKQQLGNGYNGSLYAYGSALDGTEWDGTDAKFCIKTYETFVIYDANELNCPSREYSIVSMAKVDVKPGSNKFTFGN